MATLIRYKGKLYKEVETARKSFVDAWNGDGKNSAELARMVNDGIDDLGLDDGINGGDTYNKDPNGNSNGYIGYEYFFNTVDVGDDNASGNDSEFEQKFYRNKDRLRSIFENSARELAPKYGFEIAGSASIDITHEVKKDSEYGNVRYVTVNCSIDIKPLEKR